MKPLIVLSVLICLLGGCSKNLYYEYQNKDTGNYAVITIKKNKKVSSYKAINKQEGSSELVFLEGDFQVNDNYLTMETLGMVIMISSDLNLDYCVNLESTPNEVFVFKQKSDNNYEFAYMKEVKCFEKYGISHFPLYFKKVKKINYTHFPESIRAAISVLDKNGDIEEAKRLLEEQKSKTSQN